MPGGVGDPRRTDWTIAVGAGAMVRDLDFGDIDEMKAVSGRRRCGFGTWVVYSLIAALGLAHARDGVADSALAYRAVARGG